MKGPFSLRSRAGGGQRAPLLTALDAAGSAEGDAGWMRDTPSTPPSPPGVSGGAPVVPMEVAGRGQRLQMQEKLRILEDLNMLYIRQIAISLQVGIWGPPRDPRSLESPGAGGPKGPGPVESAAPVPSCGEHPRIPPAGSGGRVPGCCRPPARCWGLFIAR